MQIEKLVAFHKTMGDVTRIRIISILANGPKRGQAIAGILSLTAPTISHHLTKLKEINLVRDRREKNSVYYFLNDDVLQHYSRALPEMILKKGESKMDTQKLSGEQKKILENFLTADGRLKTIPAQRKKKLIVLYHIASLLENGRKYEEKDLNSFIQTFHDDYATIRRELIIGSIMYRENSIYELNPREMWATIE
ncbi:ArsR family transcriptional regulator (plasmid) [Peribacillus muralis]|uniref:ArsR family transcriptional regulator n=1 Tax=Peribacillus muralis TaxID=264697 RepID=A0A1B3XPV4_9BACI|nr:metalloregulator ArsR/SmtB family transcription factor [Peribacillus muralis]AOH55257.1 ArsR family transcriptional regulator [Peribacillus muralis]AOH57406.1 ArsR family transcriptional regulator [Peribacillus muralis]